jgi:hypothetical protein
MKGKKFFSPQLFRPKVFDMDFPKKFFNGVFELPLLRNAQKRHKKKLKKEREGTYVPDLSSARYTSLSFFFSFGAPRLAAPAHIRMPSAHSSRNLVHQAALTPR